MDYTLAMELKDAGFPFTTGGYFIEPSGMAVTGAQTADRLDLGYVPSLDELIEACGEDFFALMKTDKGWMAQASMFKGTSKNFVDHLSGQSPVEAVARLWLALQKS